MEVWNMNEDIKPAYGLVQINITNQAEFMERYAQHVFPILAKWGIEMIAGSDTPVTKEGPSTKPGLIATSSRELPLTVSHAARSAKVLLFA